MDTTKSKLQEMLDYYKELVAQVKERAPAEAFDKVAESIKNAMAIMADNDEKQAWVHYVLCDQTYRLAFYIWRHDENYDVDLLNRVREIPLPEDAIEYARGFGAEDEKIKERIMKEVQEVDTRRAGIDVLKGVLSGDDLETAKKKQADFEARMNKAMGISASETPAGE